MEKIQLILPTSEHRAAAEAFKQEFFDWGETTISGSALLDQMDYPQWLKNTLSNNDPQTIRSDWVAASTFFAIRESDNFIVGMIDIRHNLNHDFLSQYGGHIGYAVRPNQRQKGYATEMLEQALDFARDLGLSQVMLGCLADNIASKKTIEKCGGKLAEVKPYLDGHMMAVYWITL